MGILDTIIGGVTRNVTSGIQNTVSNAAYKATRTVTDSAGKTVAEKMKQATINPDDAIKKITFSKRPAGGYDLFYDMKELAPINASDLKLVQGKQRLSALMPMKIILRPKHEVFKHDKVVTTIAERILDDMGIVQ
ncbi:hypothetical protein HZC08_01105 [Candidatus Micrarchaeota archaeon]|nr:hypothetical protein [Candidatus Micrarchaeota archaeon]